MSSLHEGLRLRGVSRRPPRIAERGTADPHCDVNGSEMEAEYEFTPMGYEEVTALVGLAQLVFGICLVLRINSGIYYKLILGIRSTYVYPHFKSIGICIVSARKVFVI